MNSRHKIMGHQALARQGIQSNRGANFLEVKQELVDSKDNNIKKKSLAKKANQFNRPRIDFINSISSLQNNSVSVIIPAYNAEKTLESALISVFNQTCADLIIEIIVINDGSTDDTENVARNVMIEYSTIPIKIITQYNQGVSCARNVGLALAKGEWVAFLDADDEWLPHRIERQFCIISQIDHIDFIGAWSSDSPLYILWKKVDCLYKASLKDLLVVSFPCTSTVLMRRRIYEQIGGFKQKWRYGEDIEYFTRIVVNFNFYHLPERLIIFGHGKRAFGENGLSSHLRSMHQAYLKMLSEIYARKHISTSFFLFLRMFYELKYVMRIIITLLYRVFGHSRNFQ